MNVDSITRFEFDGPDGLTEWDPLDPADYESGEPVQRGHLYFNDEKLGLMVGVWDCTPNVGKMEAYGVDEFMYVLEGSVTMELEDGTSVTISTGESFVVPKGLKCKWIQTEYMRKFFVIFDNANTKAHDNPEQFGIILPNAADPVTSIKIDDTSQFLGAVPAQHEHDYFADASGQFLVGMWNSEAFERDVAPFNRYELMCILEGSVTMSDGAGNEQVFKAGDVAFVPKGAPYKWKSDEFVSKFYCIFMPAEEAQASNAAE